ncbi:MAG: phosphomannomutase/phosphoglucomutase [bacterium]|nr:phosphomannomutase/phosphoglucomutase [bacterium]
MPNKLAINLEKIFKAYDIRGVYPEEINEETAYLTAKAYAEWLKPKKVALGRDVRNSGDALLKEAKRGLIEMGVDVYEIGVATTDMLSFAVAEFDLDGGIIVTASHNEAKYNGLKIYREKAIPVSSDSGLLEIREIAKNGDFTKCEKEGKSENLDFLNKYIQKVLSFIDVEKIKPMKVVVNPNFGAAGKAVDKLAEVLPLELVKINYEEDGSFPKGKPDPSSPENRAETVELVKKSGADFAAIWDADADRCVFLDENGEYVQGTYMTAIIAEMMLQKNPGCAIVSDISLTWPVIGLVKNAGGKPVICKVGTSFIIEKMVKEKAVFAGEISGHMYFRDCWNADNGMIPFLLILERLSASGEKLSEIANPLREKFPNAMGLNFPVSDTDEKIKELAEAYNDANIDYMDGISIEYPGEYRFNVRASNTEPLLRLHIEGKSQDIVDEKIKEITKLVEA